LSLKFKGILKSIKIAEALKTGVSVGLDSFGVEIARQGLRNKLQLEFDKKSVDANAKSAIESLRDAIKGFDVEIDVNTKGGIVKVAEQLRKQGIKLDQAHISVLAKSQRKQIKDIDNQIRDGITDLEFTDTLKQKEEELASIKRGERIPTGAQALGSFSGKSSLGAGSQAILNENKKMVTAQKETNSLLKKALKKPKGIE